MNKYDVIPTPLLSFPPLCCHSRAGGNPVLVDLGPRLREGDDDALFIIQHFAVNVRQPIVLICLTPLDYALLLPVPIFLGQLATRCHWII